MKRFLLPLLVALGALRAEAQVLFSDDFTRATDPGALAPWAQSSDTWSVTGGALRSDSTSLNTVSLVYITNSWTNYAVQARIRFSSTNADMGGIGGRFNPWSGAHYAAWIAPEGSPAGPCTLQLLKVQYWWSQWFAYEYTNATWQPMQTVTLAAVGTNWHTLRLAFQGNQITVSYDGNQVITATDVESDPYLSGGIIAGMSTAYDPYSLWVDDVSVTWLPPVLTTANDLYYVTRNGSLTVPAPGVLNNDTAGPQTNLTAIRLTNPAHGTLTFNSNGGFTYIPTNNFTGIDSFTYLANDGLSNSAPATVVIDVTATTNIFYDNFTRTAGVNAYAPWVVGLGEWNISGGVLLGSGTETDYYSDTYVPTVVGDFTIQAQFQLPIGAWACGLLGRLNPVTGERYVANVYPESSPFGPTPALRLIKFHSWGTWSSTWTPMALVSLPPVGTSFHTLKLAFYGSQIDVYFDGNLVVHADDDNVDGLPFYRSGCFGAHMYMEARDQATFGDLSVTALPGVNFPPVLPVQNDRTILPLTTLLVTNTATDSDIPANTLTYSLLTAPANAAIDTNGIISWTPTQVQDPSTNLFTTVVTDFFPTATNAQHLSATNTFTVIVNTRPVVTLDSIVFVSESYAPTNNSLDPGETVTLLFYFENTGVGDTVNLVATLLPGNGVTSPSGPKSYGALLAGGSPVSQPFTFTVSGNCGDTITANFQLQDGSRDLGTLAVPLPVGSSTTIFQENFDSVTAPALPAGWTTVSSGYETDWVTAASRWDTAPNTAFVMDVPNIGTSELVSPPIAVNVWQAQLSFANYYALEYDPAIPTNGWDGGVLEIKIGTNDFVDILDAGGSFVTNGYNRKIDPNWESPLINRWAWSGDSGGSIPTIVDLPATAYGQTIQLKWLCGTDNGNTLQGWWIDTIAIRGLACIVNRPPTLPAQDNQTLAELSLLTITNQVTDPGVPANAVSYSLLNPPLGAQIDANGVITWTPDETQGPSTNPITTIAVNSGVGSLRTTNSFTVVVQEINLSPVLAAQTDQTLVGLASLTVTNTATDPDIPTNTVTYVLESGPTNAAIDSNGIITWTPTPSQVPSVQVFTTVVTDDNPWAVNSQHLSATNSFTVTVNAIRNPPLLPDQTDRVVIEPATLVVTNTAIENDVPALPLAYQLTAAPNGAIIDKNGVIQWTPSPAQAPSTNLFQTVVTDAPGGSGLSDTNSFTVVVLPPTNLPAPVFMSIAVSQDVATLTWSAVTGQTYRLQYNEDLNSTNWNDLPLDVLATGPSAGMTDNVGVSTQRFYRVILVP